MIPATMISGGVAHLARTPLVPAQFASMQLTLVPVAPIVLLPFILIIFVIFAPLWGAVLLVLAVLRAIFWPIERVLAALHVPGAGEGSAALARASRWVSTLGGLTERYTASRAAASRDAVALDDAARRAAGDRGPGA
ncbi:MAG TPA: hypothetical protein VNS52_05420 [Gemmatimonadaceae bacterium]|nr:hypothetical protein [Gemmatimonadaceae bacterium]